MIEGDWSSDVCSSDLVDTTGNSLDESLDVLLETIKERLKA